MSGTADSSAAPTLGALRDRFLDDHGFGGPRPLIEWVKLGPVPFPVPNPPIRQRVIALHDHHHLLTGYKANWPGEFEISAWEVGAGLCGDPVAWTFCPAGFAAGMVVWPRRTVAAYARGRAGRTLLDLQPAEADALTLDEAHARCGTAAPAPAATAGDWARAVGWAALGAVVGVLPPLGWLLSRFSRGRAK